LRRKYDSRPWPANLGTLETAPSHFIDAQPNAAGVQLTSMMALLNGDLAALNEYVKTELERRDVDIGAPPPQLARYLREHGAQLDFIRDHILAAGAISTADFRPHVELTNLFIARGFMNGAWDDLHAVWVLDRQLWQRRRGVATALLSTRMLNAAAAKMPLPVPSWLEDLRSFDYEQRVAAMYQADALDLRQTVDESLAEHRFLSLIDGWQAVAADADLAEQLRVRTGELLAAKGCDFASDPLQRKPMAVAPRNAFGALGALMFTGWDRVTRFRAEREATGKILALRRGETPSAKSACTDGEWLVSAGGVKFSRDIAVPHGIRFPLAYDR